MATLYTRVPFWTRIENQLSPAAAVDVAQMGAMLPSMQLEAGKLPKVDLRACNSGAQKAMADGEERA